jgi:putative tricarboxylic transport membrane protein
MAVPVARSLCYHHANAPSTGRGTQVSNASNMGPRTGPLAFIRSPRDFFGGMGLVALAVIAWWASIELPGQQGFAFGPGTAPRLFMLLLGINGAIILLMGLFIEGPGLEKWSFRGPLFVLGGVLLFAATIRPLGLVLSTFMLVQVSSAGSREVNWFQAVIWGVVLSIFCAILFPYVLNLPMQLWPRF